MLCLRAWRPEQTQATQNVRRGLSKRASIKSLLPFRKQKERSNERVLHCFAGINRNSRHSASILWSMKTTKPTRIALAYCRNSSYSTLLIPAKGQLKNFESKYGFSMCVGCCFKNYPKTRQGVGRYWMVHFHHAVVRDNVDPQALHELLMMIPEFRRLCAFDIPLMEEYSYWEE